MAWKAVGSVGENIEESMSQDTFKVELGGFPNITRKTIDFNESVLEPILQILGTRVGVEVLYFHVEALFKMMQIPSTRSQAS